MVTYSTPFMPKPDTGFRLVDGRAIWDAIVNANATSQAYGITAAGTTQATATPLTSVTNQVDTTASGTGVNLPNTRGLRTVPFQTCYIFNNGANSLTVYAAQGITDTINGIAGATGVQVPVGGMATFLSAKGGVWFSDVGTGSTFTFGAGSGTFLPEGNLFAGAYGQTANEPSSTNGDYVLAVYSIPANSFSATGKGLIAQAAGSYGGTANVKTCKIIFNPSAAVVGSTVTGGTTVATTGALTQSGTGWELLSTVYKFGAANSNTQYAQQLRATSGTVEAGVGVPAFPAATENAAILIAVTGNAVTAVSDINLNLFTVNALN